MSAFLWTVVKAWQCATDYGVSGGEGPAARHSAAAAGRRIPGLAGVCGPDRAVLGGGPGAAADIRGRNHRPARAADRDRHPVPAAPLGGSLQRCQQSSHPSPQQRCAVVHQQITCLLCPILLGCALTILGLISPSVHFVVNSNGLLLA